MTGVKTTSTPTAIVLLTLLVAGAGAADAPVAWEESFDGSEVPTLARFYYE